MVDHCQLWVISQCLVFIKTTILIVLLQDVDILVETTILSMLCPNSEVADYWAERVGEWISMGCGGKKKDREQQKRAERTVSEHGQCLQWPMIEIPLIVVITWKKKRSEIQDMQNLKAKWWIHPGKNSLSPEEDPRAKQGGRVLPPSLPWREMISAKKSSESFNCHCSWVIRRFCILQRQSCCHSQSARNI